MLTPYVYAALAHERHQAFLAEAETDRRARQARLHRQQAGTSGARKSPLRRRPAWLHRVRVPSFTCVLRIAATAVTYDAESQKIPVTVQEAESKTWEPAAQHCSPGP